MQSIIREKNTEECCTSFSSRPPGVTTYQFNFNISNNFFTCWLSFCCKVLPMVWLTCTIEFAEFSTLIIYLIHHLCDITSHQGLWSVKKLKYAYGVPNESFTVDFFMALPCLKERFYSLFYFQNMQWRPCTVLNFTFLCLSWTLTIVHRNPWKG